MFFVNGYLRLIVAIVEFAAGSLTLLKVYRGSKSIFAYKLLLYTLLQALGSFLMYLAIIVFAE